MKKQEKNALYKARGEEKKVLAMLLVTAFLMIFLVNLVSSEMEWDNVKSYDDLTKTATITDNLGFGGALAEITLTSPHNVNVIYGEDRLVAEFTIKNYENYDNVFNDLDFINLKNGKTMTKNFQYKYKNYITHSVDDYAEICKLNDLGNGTSLKYDCYLKEVGKHNETYFEWKPLNDKALLPEGDWEIGLFVDVMPNEKGEWIPTFYGKNIPEWAEWTESLNTNIISYYDFEDGSGTTVTDSLGSYDMTSNSSTWVTGKVGTYAMNFSRSAKEYARTTSNVTGTAGTNWTINGWFKLQTTSYGTNPATVIYEGATYTADDESRAELWINYDAGANTYTIASPNSPAPTKVGSVVYDAWTMLTLRYDVSQLNLTAWKNGVLLGSRTQDGETLIDGEFKIGKNSYGEFYTNMIADEIGLWNRSLSSTELTQLYNGGTGITYSDVFNDAPTVNLNTPVEAENITTQNVIFNATISDDNGQITNASLIINGVINQTNVSVINNTQVTFSVVLPDGDYNWTYEAYDNFTERTTPSIRNLTINTAPTIHVFSPTNTTYTNQVIYFNATATQSVNNWIVNYNGTNYSLSSINSTINVEEGNFQLLFYGENVGTGVYGLNDSVYFGVDNSNPQLIITEPTGNLSFQKTNQNISVNWTILDEHLDDCFIEYAGVNYSVTCTDNSTFINLTNPYDRTLIFYSNDTFGNVNVTTASWDYLAFLNSESYNSFTFEGASETFTANITSLSGFTPNLAYLYYNNTFNAGSITSVGGNSYTLSETITIPDITTTTNKTFYWNIFVGGQNTNTTSHQQAISPISLDDCTTNTIQILNFTMKDEEQQYDLNATANNTLIEVDLDLYSTSNYNTPVFEYSNSFSQTLPARVCINNTLGSTEYKMFTQVNYKADSFANEFYNIQNQTLTGTTNLNITLYDLNSTSSTEFLIRYYDNSFRPVDKALINITRKYVGEGVYKSVEIPKTDEDGQSKGHFDTDNVIYTIVVSKNGVILSTFDDIVVKCQDILTSECTLNLNAFQSGTEFTNYSDAGDISYNVEFDSTARTITLYFTSNGGVKTITTNATKFDRFGNDTICDESLTSTSGSIVCNVPVSYGNVTAIYQVYSDGELVTTRSYTIRLSSRETFGGDIYFVLFLVMLTIPLMLISSTIGIIIGVILGLIMLTLLNIYEGGGILGTSSALIWALIAAGIIIYKITKR